MKGTTGYPDSFGIMLDCGLCEQFVVVRLEPYLSLRRPRGAGSPGVGLLAIWSRLQGISNRFFDGRPVGVDQMGECESVCTRNLIKHREMNSFCGISEVH